MGRVGLLYLILEQFLGSFVGLVEGCHQEFDIGLVLVEKGGIGSSRVSVAGSCLLQFLLLLDIGFDDSLLELFVLDFEQVDLAEVSIELVEVLHVVVQASYCEFVVVQGIPHRLVGTLDLFQPPHLTLDGHLQDLLRFEGVDVPVEPLHLVHGVPGLLCECHHLILGVSGECRLGILSRAHTFVPPFGNGQAISAGSRQPGLA